MGGIPAIFADYNTVDGDGNAVDLSQRRTEYYYYSDSEKTQKVTGTAKARLTDEEAATYTVKNVLSGDDNWQPELLTEACEAPVPVADAAKKTITWPSVPYAICYVVTKNGCVDGFTTVTHYDYDGTSEYSVQAANEYGGLSAAAKVSTTPTAIMSATVPSTAPTAIYGVSGSRRAAIGKGVNIVSNTNGTTQKVIGR